MSWGCATYAVSHGEAPTTNPDRDVWNRTSVDPGRSRGVVEKGGREKSAGVVVSANICEVVAEKD